MNIKRIIPIIAASSMIFSLYGCTNTVTQVDEITTAPAEHTTQPTEKSDDMFTDRDYRTTYDESNAVKISLIDNQSSCKSQNVDISNNTVTIRAEGTYVISGSLSNGQIIVDADETARPQLILNTVDINCDTSAAIYVKQADKVFITLAEGSENSLSNKKDFIAIDDNNIDSVVFSKSNITFNGNGMLNISAAYGHGIVSKGDLKITAGTYSVNAAGHSLQGKDSIRIADGTLNLTAEKDGLNSSNDNENKGFIYIIGGEVNISAADDGMHTSDDLTIKGGTINITESYEGLEGETINISGGAVTIKSSDDGINATGSSETSDMANDDPFSADSNCSITISGGNIKVDADGDGIDSNGNITITGGETYVEGPTNNGNAALDYNGTATISGGIFIAIGSSGMAQNFSDGSTQCAMLVNISGASGDQIVISDSKNNEIFTYTADKQYDCAVISTPEIVLDETYTVKSGKSETEITMTDTIYGSSMMTMGGRHPMNNPDMNHGPMGGGKGMPRP